MCLALWSGQIYGPCVDSSHEGRDDHCGGENQNDHHHPCVQARDHTGELWLRLTLKQAHDWTQEHAVRHQADGVQKQGRQQRRQKSALRLPGASPADVTADAWTDDWSNRKGVPEEAAQEQR